tara:strand:- start:1609 stop:1719 length:111 start_codon:yes stop_codon:yes gene_type:complete
MESNLLFSKKAYNEKDVTQEGFEPSANALKGHCSTS